MLMSWFLFVMTTVHEYCGAYATAVLGTMTTLSQLLVMIMTMMLLVVVVVVAAVVVVMVATTLRAVAVALDVPAMRWWPVIL